jgi:hypothetical protein
MQGDWQNQSGCIQLRVESSVGHTGSVSGLQRLLLIPWDSGRPGQPFTRRVGFQRRQWQWTADFRGIPEYGLGI